MRVVFYGAGNLATPSFEAMIRAEHEVLTLVTEPGRADSTGPEVPAGAWRIPVLEPADPAQPEVVEAIRRLAPDLQVCVGYRRRLPKALLQLTPSRTIKAHASLLPRHRGPEPVAWAILAGHRETGVTTLLMDEGLDTGPTLLARTVEIGLEETAAELTTRLAQLAAQLLIETIDGLAAGKLQPVPQASAGASEAPSLDSSLASIDWSLPAEVLARRIRVLGPAQAPTASLEGREVRLLRATPSEGPAGEPGVVQSAGFEGILVTCGQGSALRVTQLQIEGLRAMSPSAVISRLRVQRGSRFA
jgi:methionyl-tRNA formyltransferase